MEAFLLYQLKAALLLAVLYALYRLLLSGQTFHSFNRMALLTVLLLSFCLPAVRVTLPADVRAVIPVRTVESGERHKSETTVSVGAQPAVTAVAKPAGEVPDGPDTGVQPESADARTSRMPWMPVLLAVYAIGVVVFLVRKAVSVREIVGIIRDGAYRNRIDACDLIESDMVSQPVSWMRCIVMPRRWLNRENQAVWQHESLHARQLHSLDLLFTDILSAFQWFNPVMQLVHNEIELIHEFEADRSVIDSGTSPHDYKMMLVETLAANRGYAMSSWLSESSIKQRIDMLERKDSNPAARLRGGAILLAAGLFMAFNASCTPNVSEDEAVFEDGRVWIYSDGTAKVRTADGIEASVRTDEVARYLGRYRKFRTTRISLRYMDGVSGLEQVQPMAEALDRYGIKTAVACDDDMLEHMVKAAYRRAHVVDLGGGQYRFELNCEQREKVQYALSDTARQALRTLSVTGDLALMKRWIGMFSGHGVAIYPKNMPWADALSMAEAAWKRGMDQVSLVYDDASPAADLTGLNAYHQLIKGENGPRTIALIPQKTKLDAQPGETAVSVMSRHNASYTSDWLDKGEHIEHPRCLYNADVRWLHVTHVVKTDHETVILFYSFQYNDLWSHSLTGSTIKAGDKEYKETGHHGLDGFEEKRFWSPDCGFYHFALHFPALPDDVETVDLVDSKTGAVRIRRLQVSERQTAMENTFTMALYGSYSLKTLNFKENKPDIVKAENAVLSENETVVYMDMFITEASSFKGHVGSDFTLTLANGRELKPLRIEGVPTDRDFDRGGDDVRNHFQIVFPASTPREWMEGRAILKGRVCHELVRIEMLAMLQIDDEPEDEEAFEKLMKAAGFDSQPEAPSDNESGISA